MRMLVRHAREMVRVSMTSGLAAGIGLWKRIRWCILFSTGVATAMQQEVRSLVDDAVFRRRQGGPAFTAPYTFMNDALGISMVSVA
jgi:hypothetical protein